MNNLFPITYIFFHPQLLSDSNFTQNLLKMELLFVRIRWYLNMRCVCVCGALACPPLFWRVCEDGSIYIYLLGNMRILQVKNRDVNINFINYNTIWRRFTQVVISYLMQTLLWKTYANMTKKTISASGNGMLVNSCGWDCWEAIKEIEILFHLWHGTIVSSIEIPSLKKNIACKVLLEVCKSIDINDAQCILDHVHV